VRYFFVSYAHVPDDDNDQLVETFARKLDVEVAIRAGQRGGDTGFLDTTGLRVGESWETELARAVATCTVFILLYSPLYFESAWCSEEWQAFDIRLRAYRPQEDRAPLLVPLFWIPTPEIHPRLSRYQLTDRSFGEPYTARGLRRLVQLREREYRAGYYEFLDALATRIVDVAKRFPITPHPDPAGLMAQARRELAASATQADSDTAAPPRPRGTPPPPGFASEAAGEHPAGAPHQRRRPILSSYVPDPNDPAAVRSDNGDD
jgi:hypothetical protein